jgi:hypothetical protein
VGRETSQTEGNIMTVEELIAALVRLPGQQEIFVLDEDPPHWPLRITHLSEDGILHTVMTFEYRGELLDERTFEDRDRFDRIVEGRPPPPSSFLQGFPGPGDEPGES